MMDHKFYSRFTPRRTNPELLEAVHVPMDGLLERAFRGVKESATSQKKCHFLFHGSRGSGKSHLVRLLEYRISQDEALDQKLRIAWLNEDESSTSFLDLLVRTYRALSERYPEVFPSADLEILYGKDPELVLVELETLLRERLAGRSLVMLLENTDGVFTQLSEIDLKRWRAFLQNDPFVITVATAQQLVGEVREHDEPFYGFFDTHHLRPFTVDEAVSFLKGIAQENGDAGLVKFLATRQGRGRVRALHRLSGGNPRLYVVFSDFVTHEALDRLVPLFEELVDEQLTPYYQERLRWLSPLQRKIVEVLCARRSPVPVKDIAAALFTGPTSIATQLKRLREMGYVTPNPRGREVLYELAEPLMRLSLEVKKTSADEPLRVIVDFLRVWYDHETLQSWTASSEGIAHEGATQIYARAAVESYYEGGSHLRLHFLRKDLEGLSPRSCNIEQLEHFRAVAEESDDPDDWREYALAVHYVGDRAKAEEALTFFNEILATKELSNLEYSEAISFRAIIHACLNEFPKALADFSNGLELTAAPAMQRARNLLIRGLFLSKLERTGDALADYNAVIELEGTPIKYKVDALISRGVTLGNLGHAEEALGDYSSALKMNEATTEQRALAHYNRGVTLGKLMRTKEALIDFNALLELEGVSAEDQSFAFFNRGVAFNKLGQTDDAIVSFSAVMELADASAEQKGRALVNRGALFRKLGKAGEALADQHSVLKLDGVSDESRYKACWNIGLSCSERAKLGEADQWYWKSLHFGDEVPDGTIRHILLNILEHLSSHKNWPGFLDSYSEYLADNAVASSVSIVAEEVFQFLLKGEERPKMQGAKVTELWQIHQVNEQLAALGNGLVRCLKWASELSPAIGDFEDWVALWHEVAGDAPEFKLPLRLVDTGIAYLKSRDANGEGDRGTLLELPAEEREIVCEALGIES